MIIAIASGKGGTGKTTLSVALAQAISDNVTYLDCDVEEPNGHIFLNPEIEETLDVMVSVPVVNEEKCTGCNKCAEICQFNAILCLGAKAMTFSDMCHNCGGCKRVCPENAITHKDLSLGKISVGQSGSVRFVEGKLDIGKAMSPPIIRAVKRKINSGGINIIDCPPGTSCPMITAVTGADYATLVTEPTPFGLHDLILAVETMRELKMPFGVIINRFDSGDKKVEEYCENEKIDILLKIPDSRTIAEAYSKGLTLLEVEPKLKDELLRIVEFAKRDMKGEL